jgi:hypothetical protein
LRRTRHLGAARFLALLGRRTHTSSFFVSPHFTACIPGVGDRLAIEVRDESPEQLRVLVAPEQLALRHQREVEPAQLRFVVPAADDLRAERPLDLVGRRVGAISGRSSSFLSTTYFLNSATLAAGSSRRLSRLSRSRSPSRFGARFTSFVLRAQ